MDEQQVRQLVRQAIARHMGGAPAAAPVAAASGPGAASAVAPAVPIAAVTTAGHVSVAQFHLVRPAGETECLIEPTVTCNHCGHCLCYGH